MSWQDILKVDDVEKGWFKPLGMKREQPPQFAADGLKFSSQNGLNLYNRTKTSLGDGAKFLLEELKAFGNVFLGERSIQSAIPKIQQKAKEEYNKQQLLSRQHQQHLQRKQKDLRESWAKGRNWR